MENFTFTLSYRGSVTCILQFLVCIIKEIDVSSVEALFPRQNRIGKSTWTAAYSTRYEKMQQCCCEHGNEPSVSIKG
jgi:hypothetical protein